MTIAELRRHADYLHGEMNSLAVMASAYFDHKPYGYIAFNNPAYSHYSKVCSDAYKWQFEKDDEAFVTKLRAHIAEVQHLIAERSSRPRRNERGVLRSCERMLTMLGELA